MQSPFMRPENQSWVREIEARLAIENPSKEKSKKTFSKNTTSEEPDGESFEKAIAGVLQGTGVRQHEIG